MTQFKLGAALLAAAASLALLATGAVAQQNPPSEEPYGTTSNPLAGLHAPVPAHHALAPTSTRPWERPPQVAEPVPAHQGVATIPGVSPPTPVGQAVAGLGIRR